MQRKRRFDVVLVTYGVDCGFGGVLVTYRVISVFGGDSVSNGVWFCWFLGEIH
jgi:hypothetical protein